MLQLNTDEYMSDQRERESHLDGSFRGWAEIPPPSILQLVYEEFLDPAWLTSAERMEVLNGVHLAVSQE